MIIDFFFFKSQKSVNEVYLRRESVFCIIPGQRHWRCFYYMFDRYVKSNFLTCLWKGGSLEVGWGCWFVCLNKKTAKKQKWWRDGHQEQPEQLWTATFSKLCFLCSYSMYLWRLLMFAVSYIAVIRSAAAESPRKEKHPGESRAAERAEGPVDLHDLELER